MRPGRRLALLLAAGLTLLASAPSALPHGAAVQNGPIAFVSGGSVFTLTPGSGRRRFVTGRDPAWTRDGSQLAFSRSGEIWTANADGSGAKRIAAHQPGQSLRDPSWSPDASRIAYDLIDRPNGNLSLWTMRADGTDRRQLVSGDGAAPTPAWSPDGTRILFVQPPELFGDGEIHVVRAGGGGAHILVKGSDGEDFDPAWSPDGRRIAFTRGTPGEQTGVVAYDVYLARADGTGVRLLVKDGRTPAWSPDGKRIVFEHTASFTARPRSSYGRARELYMVAATGAGKPVRLTRNPAAETDPAWRAA